jgi:hypothetical protein
MRIIIHDDAFAAPQTAILCALFLMGVEGRHQLLVHPTWSPRNPLARTPPPCDAPGPNLRAWYDTLPNDARRTVLQALSLGAASMARPRRTIAVTTQPQHTRHEHATPGLALFQCLVTPLMVYLENGINDATFIRRMADKDELEQIERYERSGWLRFLHSNGNTGIAPLVRHASHEDRQRMYMICDRDAAEPAMSVMAQRAQAACQAAGVPLHIWRRWAIESYIPLPLLRQFRACPDNHARELSAAEFDQRYEAVATLGEQRYAQNMKAAIHDEIARLYHWRAPRIDKDWPAWRAADPEARAEISELLKDLFSRM